MQRVRSIWLAALVQFLMLVQCLSISNHLSIVPSTNRTDKQEHASALDATTSPSVLDREVGTNGPFPPSKVPNLQIDISWHMNEALNPWAVYLLANHLMYLLALQDWSDPVSEETRMVKDMQGKVGIITTDDTPNRGLTTELTVRALYGTVHYMATSMPGFFAAKVSISASGRPAGTMLFYRPESLSIYNISIDDRNSTAEHNDTLALQGTQQNGAGSRSLTAESGEIIEPEDERLRITYTYDGKNAPVQDIAFAVFDGLAQSARLDHNAKFEYITAVSASGNLVLHIGGGVHGITVWAWQVKRAFFMLFFQLYAEEKRFQELEFDLLWAGKKIASGYVMKMPSIRGSSNITEAISSR